MHHLQFKPIWIGPLNHDWETEMCDKIKTTAISEHYKIILSDYMKKKKLCRALKEKVK